MDDLISRSAVIDVLKETGIIQDNDLGHLVVDEINGIPTAYNVNKVMEKINEQPYKQIDVFGMPQPFISRRSVENIVKAGGVNE